jgi:hypothetical protein
MKEIDFKYFLNGEEVNGDLINWDYSTSVRCKDNEIYVEFSPEDADYIYGFSVEKDVPSIFKDLIGSILLNTSKIDSVANRQEEQAKSQVIMQNSQAEMIVDLAKNLTQGVKHNKFKVPLDIVQTRQFPKALQALALATAFGNNKYKETDKDFLNFKRVDGGSQTYFDAAARHNSERGEVDEDSGLPHVIHAVWDMMAALEIYIEESGINIKDFSKKYLEYLHKSK